MAEDKKLDPFYLSSSDSPGATITPTKFNGDNYNDWSRDVRVALRSKRKFGFVNGAITKPTDKAKLEEWYTVQSMLVSWIKNTIHYDLRPIFANYEDDAQELWDTIKARYCVVNGARVCQLKKELAECKQLTAEPVVVYYGRINKLWTDLSNLRAMPSCRCNKCTCKLEDEYQSLMMEDRLYGFLLGLDSTYAAIRSQLLTLDPLPTVDKAFQSITQVERVNKTGVPVRDDHEAMMALKVHADLKEKRKAENAKKFCKHCQLYGHDASGCFDLIGYPEWWGERPRGGRGGGRQSGGGGRGGSGGRGGGYSRPQDYQNTGAAAGYIPGDKNRVKAHHTHTGTSAAQGAPTNLEESGLINFTPEQWAAALEVVNYAKPRDRLNGPNDEEADWRG